jgi:hypothetical protein
MAIPLGVGTDAVWAYLTPLLSKEIRAAGIIWYKGGKQEEKKKKFKSTRAGLKVDIVTCFIFQMYFCSALLFNKHLA